MANAPKAPMGKNDRIIRLLSALVVLIFAAILVYRFSPWGEPEGQQVSSQTPTPGETVEAPEMQNVANATLMLPTGPVEIELWPEIAPLHAERVLQLAGEGFYDGIVFHRVIEGFMAQTGDPTGTGSGGSDLEDLPAEFSAISFQRGILGMARTQDPNSANSQFFIMLAPAPHLDGQYTAFGRVLSGMEHVDAIKKGSRAANGLVTEPDQIISFKPTSK
jgi:peptidylprolyl isomerase